MTLFDTPKGYLDEIKEFRKNIVFNYVWMYFILLLFLIICILIIVYHPTSLLWRVIISMPLVSASSIIRLQFKLARERDMEIIEDFERELTEKFLL